jgi:carbonic anhydrase/acetyltransferase-like protein (isoleucine patch superfamily)
VGALTLIKEGEQIAPRSVVVGNPGKVIKSVTEEMLNWKTEGTTLYQQLPRHCFDELKKCTPLRRPRKQTPNREPAYLSWKKKQKK